MPLYNSTSKTSPIMSVEFSPVPEGNCAFITLRDDSQKERIRQWLTSEPFGQQIIAETKVNGHPVFVTHGQRSQKSLLTLIASQEGEFTLHYPQHKLDLWKVRGTMGTIGQLGQLASSLMPLDGHPDYGTLVFALSNLAANGINIIFGGEKKPDIHHKHYLKEEFNRRLAPHLRPGESLPSVDDNRADLRKEPEAPRTLGQKFYDFMKRNSVIFGEIGLRYFGSFSLAFPISKKWHENPANPLEITRKTISLEGWGKGIQGLATGDMKLASQALNHDFYSRVGGLTYMTGKTIAFTSKIPDPYDPRPHTALDKFREHVSFHLSSAIEACAGATIAYDRLRNKTVNGVPVIVNGKFVPNRIIKVPNWKIIPEKAFGIALRGAEHRDYLGGIGGVLFAAAYITRFFAPFGEKQLNIDELKAHVTDSLAKVPPEQVPQLLADCAATIKEHANGKPVEFGQVYTQMLGDLYRYHHIAPAAIAMNQNAKENEPFPTLNRHGRHLKPSTMLAAGPRELASLQTADLAHVAK